MTLPFQPDLLGATNKVYRLFDASMMAQFRAKDIKCFEAAELQLLNADLPYLLRARALLVLSYSKSASSLKLAEEAVRLIDEDVRNKCQEDQAAFPQHQLDRAIKIMNLHQQHVKANASVRDEGAGEEADTPKEGIEEDQMQGDQMQDVERSAVDAESLYRSTSRRTIGRHVPMLEQRLSGISLGSAASDAMSGIEDGQTIIGRVFDALFSPPSAVPAVSSTSNRPSLTLTPAASQAPGSEPQTPIMRSPGPSSSADNQEGQISEDQSAIDAEAPLSPRSPTDID